MQLYFFRHAEAEDGSATLPDNARQLTKRGIQRTRNAATVLKSLGLKPAHLYSSPLVRARQTADILAETLGVEVVERSEVGPGFNEQAVETLVRDAGGDSEIMFVGHEPDFSATVSALIGGGWVEIKKGGLARIDIDNVQPLRGMLVWLIAPKIFDER
jgi:phosphohistidine phosphatase